MLDNKIVCLLSGGLDSSTLLYRLKGEGMDVWPLSVYYGQRHSREMESAHEIAFGIKAHLMSIDLPEDIFKGSVLTGSGEVPKGHYSDSSMKATVVPNRNMVLLSIAAAYSISIGASKVAYAAHSGDHPIYPDCRPEFIDSMIVSLELGCGVDLVVPYVNYTKAQIVKEGLRLGVPYRQTWSCYEGGDKPCLKCGTCIERIEAFSLNNVRDPLLTPEEWVVGLSNLKKVRK